MSRALALLLALCALVLPSIARAHGRVDVRVPARASGSVVAELEGRVGSPEFLQRDPEGYADSVNQYAALANDPINNRDPTGRVVYRHKCEAPSPAGPARQIVGGAIRRAGNEFARVGSGGNPVVWLAKQITRSLSDGIADIVDPQPCAPDHERALKAQLDLSLGFGPAPLGAIVGRTGALATEAAVVSQAARTNAPGDLAAAMRAARTQPYGRVDIPPVAPAYEGHNAAEFAQLVSRLRTAEAANPAIESLRQTATLPSNYVTKGQAAASGWQPGKALGNHVPSGQIGGDVFANTTNVVPAAPGRVWYEADVGLTNTMTRAKQPGTRLLYSSDGLLYVTTDHYQSAYFVGKY